MGFLDALSSAGDAIGNYFKDSLVNTGHAYRDAWTKALPQATLSMWNGALTMGTFAGPDRDSFGKGLRLYMDGVLGAAGAILGGTVGSAFEAPVLNLGAAGLDKAYRYAVAKPLSWEYMTLGNGIEQMQEAKAAGRDGMSAFMGAVFNKDTFVGDRGMWSDQIADVTPGQAITWFFGGNLVGQLNAGNTSDPTWMRAHDPRTPAGQDSFSGDNSDFLLKYASGTTDLLLNVGADPSSAAALVSKTAKAKYFDKVATSKYVAAGLVDKEINTKAYNAFYEVAKKAKTPEELRWGSNLANSPFGGSVSTVLWAAAKHDDPSIFRDVYVVARGLDGAPMGTKNVGAWQRLQNATPRFASDMARLFANWNIGEDALMLGRNAVADGAVRSLVLNDVDAFVAAVANRDGLLGSLPGKLMGTAQPRVSLAGALRTGIHTWAMDVAPIKVGRPAAKAIQAFLPSQGWTPFIDAEDPSALSLRQFKANLERGGMSREKVNEWTSQWAAKGSREGRNAVFESAEAEAVKGIAERLGISEQMIQGAMATISRHRAGARQIVRQQRVYLTERAARQAARNMAAGRPDEAKRLRDLNKDLTAAEKRGEFGNNLVAFPGSDGELQFADLPDTGEMPSQAPDMSKPLLTSQTERIIPTLDLRSLESQLKWYLRAHPVKMVTDEVTGKRRLPVTPEERDAATIEMNPLLTKVAKTHAIWDSIITGADFTNMLWKSSALLRPAQMPRNLSDDVLRRMLIFGKANVIMGAMTGTKRAFQNQGLRGKLRHEVKAEKVAARGASRTGTLVVDTEPTDSYFRYDVPEHTPGIGARKTKKQIRIPEFGKMAQKSAEAMPGPLKTYGDISGAWLDGAISLDDFIYTLKYAAGKHATPEMRAMLPGPILDAINSHDQQIQSVAEDKLTAKNEDLPGTDIWHARALKRRVLEYYWALHHGDAPTRFLDDFRMSGLSTKDVTVTPEVDITSGRGRMRYEERVEWLEKAAEAAEKGLPRPPGEPKLNVVNKTTMNPLDRRVSDRDFRVTWLAQVIAEHNRKHKRRNYETGTVDPHQPGQIVVNPFTGEIPTAFHGLDDFTILKHTTIDIERLNKVTDAQMDLPALMDDKYKSNSPSNKMLDFVVDNLDDFMRPDTQMSMSITPDGNIRVGIARVKPEAADKGELSSTATAAYRAKNFHVAGILDAGHTDIELRTRAGVSGGGRYSHAPGTIRMRAGFNGPEGEAALHRLSAREGQGSHMLITGDSNSKRILDQMGGWGTVRWDERGYDQSWERAVNAQLSGDPVARKFLEGATDSDVLTWLESTREGAKYLHRMHYFGVNYVDHIRQIEGMVQIYVPLQDSKAGRTLRQAVLDKSATRAMLDAVEPDRSKHPEVHGASLQYTLGRGAVRQAISTGIDKAQQLISDLPTDKAARFPFFAEAYRRHLMELVRTADEHAFRAGAEIPWRLMENIEHMAREKALYDTKYHLYDVAQLNDVARFSRFVVPFSSAIMDSYLKYSRIIRDNPGVVLQGAYYWEMFERNEQIQDENGYVLRKELTSTGEEERWYSVDPETGAKTPVDADKVGSDRYVVFRFPSDLAHMVGKKFYGVDVKPVIAINKKSFNTFLDLPTSGPLVALPVNKFALSNPEFGESAVIKKFVLPFGPSSSSGKVVLPGTVRTAWDLFAGEDGLKAEGQAKAIFQAELIAYARGERDTPPSFDEVRDKAGMMQGLRFATSFISPLAMQYNSPYQPYIDAYRQLAATNPEGADEAFLARYGDDFSAVAMTVTRNNAGIQSTLASDAAFKRHADLIDTYPDLAGLIVGSEGSGEFNATAFRSMKEQYDETRFSKSVYEAQKTQSLRTNSVEKVREVMSLEDSVAELEKRRTWQKFSALQDMLTADMADKGLSSLRGPRAAELAKYRDQWVEEHKYWTDPESGKQVFSPWYEDYTNTDHALMDKRVEAMWQIVQDPDLQKRDDIRGLIDYLTLRERTQQDMAQRGFASLTSRQALLVADQWHTNVFALRERNPAFGALWNRWLSNDDNLTVA